MRPSQDLPLHLHWSSNEEYVENLLEFVSTSEIFKNLCGGVHILDFLTRKPDLYTWVLPQEWRDWFEQVEVDAVLRLLLREPLEQYFEVSESDHSHSNPPKSLIEYVRTVRRLCLDRTFVRRKAKQDLEALPRHVSVGMKPKKIHEVSQFAAFVDELSDQLASRILSKAAGEQVDNNTPIIVDFGSGQNYLGRTLACSPYEKTVVAIEQRHHNVQGAKGMDISANLAKKEPKIINKKEWKEKRDASKRSPSRPSTPPREQPSNLTSLELEELNARIPFLTALDERNGNENQKLEKSNNGDQIHEMPCQRKATTTELTCRPVNDFEERKTTKGKIIHVEKALSSGDLQEIVELDSSSSVVVSIHSCGNLTHHGLRSLVLNPTVEAVAMIGCCYNLLTERLGPPTYKLPTLRSYHPRIEALSTTFDPHGFPMSQKLEQYQYCSQEQPEDRGRRVYHLNGELQEVDTTGKGVRLNITARMMAVQAPYNWGSKDSEDFFTRHYFRALLQRIFLDLGVVQMSKPSSIPGIEIAGGTLSGKDDSGSPLIIGSLGKACFTSFQAYVRGAVDKLVKDPIDGPSITAKTVSLFQNDNELTKRYELEYAYARKHLSIIWALMAFSAGVVESTIIVDRWLWLKEQQEVGEAWVESVFDYKVSPRNMVVVGIRKRT